MLLVMYFAKNIVLPEIITTEFVVHCLWCGNSTSHIENKTYATIHSMVPDIAIVGISYN